jgi:Ca-activated chloride channel family protein
MGAAGMQAYVVPDPLVGLREASEEFSTEEYQHITDNPFRRVTDEPLSTFSIDVDTASYTNTRRFLNDGQLPPPDAVRIEEFINYFDYGYPEPEEGRPFSVSAELAGCPWEPDHDLLRVALQAKHLESEEQVARNLVFLIDVSGSMDAPDKLGLLKEAMGLLIDQLGPQDRVAMVVYAGAAGLVLDSTPGDRGKVIRGALKKLSAGGSTNGGEGIELAYQVALDHFIPGGVNRVILASDGDFNVGTSSYGDLVRLIEEKRETGVFLSTLGFGTGNYSDANMEALADKGNGNYHYIDGPREAEKVLVRELSATLVAIAKDVKIQVEFNPARVSAYRLIGYENRVLANEDFNDDTKDAGEIGAGHTVTALYELVPVGIPAAAEGVDALRYQGERDLTAAAASDEVLLLKLRYKEPDGDTSELIEYTLAGQATPFAEVSDDFRFATSVAGFGMLLRNSEHRGDLDFAMAATMADEARGNDPEGYRGELVALMQTAARLQEHN